MSFHWSLSDSDENDDGEYDHDMSRGSEFAASDAATDNHLESNETGYDCAMSSIPAREKWNDWTDLLNDGTKDSAVVRIVNGEEEENYEDSFDWEDVDPVNENRKPPSTPIRGLIPENSITIDMNNTSTNTPPTKTKRKKLKQRRRLRLALNPVEQELVRNLSRTHLLTLVSRAVYLSKMAADETTQAILLSLITDSNSFFVKDYCLLSSKDFVIPTIEGVNELVYWFNQWQKLRSERLQANERAGAPVIRPQREARKRKLSSAHNQNDQMSLGKEVLLNGTHLLKVIDYLSNHDPQLDVGPPFSISNTDRVLVFVALARSLNWRVRCVSVANPLPPDASLDVTHPLLSNCINVFRMLAPRYPSKQSSPLCFKDNKMHQRKLGNTPIVTPSGDSSSSCNLTSMQGDNTNGYENYVWVEILCQVSPSHPSLHTRIATKVTRRWIHVDPLYSLINQPSLVESILGSPRREAPASSASPSSASSTKNTSIGTRGEYRRHQRLVVEFPKKNISLSNRSRVSLTYAIAVEHDAVDSTIYHVTDVTPRYSHSWVTSMLLRVGHGHSRRASSSACLKDNNMIEGVDSWWKITLDRLNHHLPTTIKPVLTKCNNICAQTASKKGTSPSDAIILEESDSEEPGSEEPGVLPLASLTTTPPHSSTITSNSRLFDPDEANELLLATDGRNEVIPTNKAAFQHHPVYALSSLLGKTHVLHPDAKKRVCGVFKGEFIYRRTDVSVARPSAKWLYEGRRVRDEEIVRPIKQIKARKKPAKKTSDLLFQPLATYGVGIESDGSEQYRQIELARGSTPLLNDDEVKEIMQDLYGIWQTDPWTPAFIGPNDMIPVHETYRNIDLALLNPGLVHVDLTGLANAAKQLGIPYAPCLIGFEGHGGNRTPTIRGIVVHEHNASIIREAGVEVLSRTVQEEHDSERERLFKLWKKLIRGLLVKDRIEREYGNTPS